jgi:hypothetical protein
MPLEGENVMVPTDNDVAEYFYQRKLLTVNGMHTTLAFMTLCEDFDAKKELTAELMDGVSTQALSTPYTDKLAVAPLAVSHGLADCVVWVCIREHTDRGHAPVAARSCRPRALRRRLCPGTEVRSRITRTKTERMWRRQRRSPT